MIKPLSTQDILLKAALRTFAEFGYEQATVEMMTARAGVSRGSINYHFRTKEDLFLKALDVALQSAAGWIDDLGWDGQNPAGIARMFDVWHSPAEGLEDASAKLLGRTLATGGTAEQAMTRPAITQRVEKLAGRLAGIGRAPDREDHARARLIWALWLEHIRQPVQENEVSSLCKVLAPAG
jgi:AcrR family transcriptional regulator